MFARLLTRSYQQQQQGGSVSFQTFLPNSSALVNNFPLFFPFFPRNPFLLLGLPAVGSDYV
jgi:hypothetical protein